jgi:hypothetical protein
MKLILITSVFFLLASCCKTNEKPCEPLPNPNDHIYLTDSRDSAFIARFTTYPPYPVLWFNGSCFTFNQDETYKVKTADTCQLKSLVKN